MGNNRRLLILVHLAAHHEMRVGDLVAAIGLSQSALSQHLGKLRKGGLVAYRRDGQTLYYRISEPAVLPLLASVIDCRETRARPTR